MFFYCIRNRLLSLAQKKERLLTIGYLNFQGLHNKNGCKLPHLASELNNDIEILSEIWACECNAMVEGYDILTQVDPQKRAGARKGRKSGGIRILIKSNLYKQVKVLKKSNILCGLK